MLETASHCGQVKNSISAEIHSLASNALSERSLEDYVLTSALKPLIDEYLIDCEYRQHRPHTILNNRSFLYHLIRFLEERSYSHCGKQEIRLFLHYLQQPVNAGGRGVRPITAKTYHRCLTTFFKWVLAEEVLATSPMSKIKAPPVKNTLKEPLSTEQINALLEAARRSVNHRRDTAILLFMLDTGVRAAELCNLKMKDADFKNRSARVVGKGNKIRTVYWGIGTSKALLRYLRYEQRNEDTSVFTGDRGLRTGESLTPSGLFQLMRRLGATAGVKCGCHDWRRTFAVNILNNGANLISVSRMMGHETLEITKGYLALAETDIENQHRQYGPADRLKRKIK